MHSVSRIFLFALVLTALVAVATIFNSSNANATGGGGSGGGGGEAVQLTRNGSVNAAVISMVRTMAQAARRVAEVDGYLDALQEIASTVRSGAATYGDFGLTRSEANELTALVAADLIDARASLRQARNALTRYSARLRAKKAKKNNQRTYSILGNLVREADRAIGLAGR